MREMFNAMFSAITRIFKGIDHYAGAFEQVGIITETEAKLFAELSEVSREDRVRRERARLAAVAAAD